MLKATFPTITVFPRPEAEAVLKQLQNVDHHHANPEGRKRNT